VELALYNTLGRAKEAFEPFDPEHVRMYVCGPTVYDLAHIGNARPVVVFDVLFRLLKRLYPKVTYVRNITDVDDKIIDAARANDEPIEALTRRTTEAFHADMGALGALEPDVEPRATETIPEMIRMIEALIAAGHAYVAEGHVLFDVPSWDRYGRLSRHSREELIAGARVEVAPYKRDPADFVLWKPSDADQPGWDSPWGRGRPGWHLECSAMSEKHLGETFDIHGGGQDLIFPHHENEIAQSTCAHGGKEFVRYWLHNGYVTVNGEKMSKSLGNFFTVRQLLDDGHRGEAIRLALLSAQYRQPLDFSLEGLKRARKKLDHFYRILKKVRNVDPTAHGAASKELLAALCDDLNTHQAIYLHLDRNAAVLSRVAESGSESEKAKTKANLLASAEILGLLQHDPEEWFKRKICGTGRSQLPRISQSALGIVKDDEVVSASDDWIREAIKQRTEAKRLKDFSSADRIRDKLQESGRPAF